METEQLHQNGKSKQTLLIVVLVLFLGVFVYFISRNQKLSINNRASNEVALDSSIASEVMVLAYSEVSSKGTNYTLRVETPHMFAFTPEKVTVMTSSPLELPVQNTQNAYRCMDMGDPAHPMQGFETRVFTEGVGEDLDTDIQITFADTTGKKYTSLYKLEHTCTVLSNDAVQAVSPPPFNDLPTE